MDDFDDFVDFDENIFGDNEEDDLTAAIPGNSDGNIEENKANALKSVWDKTENELKLKEHAKKVRPKLTEKELTSEKGLPALKAEFDDYIFPTEQPYGKLNLLMNKMECWAHNLFPQMTFNDCLEKIEKLGHKRGVKNTMKRLRIGLSLDEEIEERNEDETEEEALPGNENLLGPDERHEDEDTADAENEEDFNKFLASMKQGMSTNTNENVNVETEPTTPGEPNNKRVDSSDEEWDGGITRTKSTKRRKIVIDDDND